MSSTSAPIAPEAFQAAIADLELEQLHAEASRLQNSIFHLERSNIALEEFRDDEDCRLAIQENVETIARQTERIDMIRNEVEKRGFSMPCGEREEEGMAATGNGNSAGVSGGVNGDALTAQVTNGNGSSRGQHDTDTEDNSREEEEEEGVYL
ncbi:hypothetical protein FN846DRAFT_972314 [Sphaerosporella brunnea]|uniref:Uncharacterized protein n=1 Tax=Sphaerosporella brunnea TaxID=1250544 RepID=A0A5J5EHG4_9PEZI|nr:hypothetical protein FN846DRAFT_972314 [Sphaerosporella brunnea]